MTKSLSDFWRTRRSYNKAIEMKTVLEDLKAFIEMAADEGNFNVSWGTTSRQEHGGGTEKNVVLSYIPLADVPTPFSGEAVDVVAGFAAHEAGHRIRDQRGQPVRLLSDSERPEGMTVSAERLIRNILEDAYIDHYLYVSKAPVLGTYIRHGRDWDMAQSRYAIDSEELKAKAQSEELTKLDILRLWIKYELYGFSSAEELKDFPDSVLGTLLSLAEITDTYCKKKGLVDAVAMYESIWGEIKGYAQPSKEDTQPSPDSGGEQSDDSDSGDGEDTQGVAFGTDQPPEDNPDGDSNKGNSEGEDAEEDEDGESEDGNQEDRNEDEQDGDDENDKDDDGSSGESEIGADKDEEQRGLPDPVDRPGEDTAEMDALYDAALPCQDEERHVLPESLSQAVEDAIVLDKEDITQSVIEEFKDEHFFDAMLDQYHSNIIVEKAATITLPDQDDMVSRSIRQIFNFRKRRKTRHSRGTEEGTVSQTRLYRAGMSDMHLYEKRDIKDSLDINVCILCDMSSSVASSQDILSQCVNSLALGLSRRKGVKVCALAYNSPGLGGKGNDVHIFRLFETGDKKVGFCKADGGTPTVAAIGAVPGLMRKLLGRANDNLLIHITDGYAHDEQYLKTSIADLIGVLAKKYNIDTYCLAILRDHVGQAVLLEKAYGKSYEGLNSYEELPEALTKLLYNLLVTS